MANQTQALVKSPFQIVSAVVPTVLLCGAAAMWAAGPLVGLAPQVAQAGGITFLCMSLWATGLLPEFVTALLFFALATLSGVGSTSGVFSGFGSSAFWLVLSGLIMGAAISKTGLGARVARAVARPLSGSYVRLIAGVVGISYGLAFVMPSNMGRITLLLPVMLALADAVRVVPGSRGRAGVVLAAGFGTFLLSTSILTANVPNLVLAGTVEALYTMPLGSVPYLVLHAPVLGVLKGLLLIGLIGLMFPDHVQPMARLATTAAPLTMAEWRLTVILAATLGLWVTAAWHGISPAWIGLAAAVLCLLPGVGFLPPEAFGQLNFRTIFYVAAILGLASMIRETGLGTLLGHGLLRVTPLDPRAPFWNFTALAGLTTVLSLAVPNGAPVLFTPMAAEAAAATGFGLFTVVMMSVLGFSTVLLPFQAPPILLALELGAVRLRDATRLSLVSAALTLLLLVPVDYLWWHWLGRL
jgi:di/tricarboxylate transporter